MLTSDHPKLFKTGFDNRCLLVVFNSALYYVTLKSDLYTAHCIKIMRLSDANKGYLLTYLYGVCKACVLAYMP